MTREQQIEKIKKLLALANSSNEHEATLAFERAQELIKSYNIETNELIITKVILRKRLHSPKEFDLLNIICNLFNSFSILDTRSGICTIIGINSGPEIAEYTFNIVHAAAKKQYSIEYNKIRSITFANSFWHGFFIGFYEKFKHLIKELSPELKMELNKFSEIELPNLPCNKDILNLGIKLGSKAEIVQGITTNKTKQDLLT